MNDAQFEQYMNAAGGGNTKKAPMLSQTTPGAWRIWRRRFTLIANHRNWNDAKQKLEAATSMEGDAATITFDLAPDNEAQTAAEFLNAMERRFIPAAASAYSRAEFKSAKQEPTESPLQFHSRLRDLFNTAYQDREAEQDPDLMNAFALGLIDVRAREKVLDAISEAENFTYTLCLARAQSKLAVNSVLGGSSSGQGAGSINSLAGQGQGDEGGRKCFACKEAGHLKKDCPYWNVMRYMNSGSSSSNARVQQGRIGKPQGRGQWGGYRGRGNGGGFRGRHYGNYRGNGGNNGNFRGNGRGRSNYNFNGAVASMEGETSSAGANDGHEAAATAQTGNEMEDQGPFNTQHSDSLN